MKALSWILTIPCLTIISACQPKDDAVPQDGIVVTNKSPDAVPGLYRSEKLTQTSYRDNSQKEVVYSEVLIQGDSVTYTAFRDGSQISSRKGLYDKKTKEFVFVIEGKDEWEHDPVGEVTSAQFKMKHGRKVIQFSKV